MLHTDGVGYKPQSCLHLTGKTSQVKDAGLTEETGETSASERRVVGNGQVWLSQGRFKKRHLSQLPSLLWALSVLSTCIPPSAPQSLF